MTELIYIAIAFIVISFVAISLIVYNNYTTNFSTMTSFQKNILYVSLAVGFTSGIMIGLFKYMGKSQVKSQISLR